MFKLWVLGSSPRRPIDFPIRDVMSQRWHVYLAECGDGSLYAGITTNPSQRLKQHNEGKGSVYVRRKGGATLVYVEPSASQSLAHRRELEIKSWNRKKKLALIAAGRRMRPRGVING